MRERSRSARRWLSHGLILAWIALPCLPARAGIRAEAVTLDYQVNHSDVILRGTCTGSNTQWSNKNIVTTYRVKVRKYLKAPGKTSLATTPEVLVSQPGGRLAKPIPIEQSYPEMAVIYPGEEVLLFLQSPDSVPATVRANYEQGLSDGTIKPMPTMQNYRLTTFNISKLSVLTNPATGKEVVTRLAYDRFGFLPTPEVMKQYAKAIEAQSRYLDVKRGAKSVRLPVRVAKLGVLAPDVGTKNQLTKEQQIRRMQSGAFQWDDFERQIEAILKTKGK